MLDLRTLTTAVQPPSAEEVARKAVAQAESKLADANRRLTIANEAVAEAIGELAGLEAGPAGFLWGILGQRANRREAAEAKLATIQEAKAGCERAALEAMVALDEAHAQLSAAVASDAKEWNEAQSKALQAPAGSPLAAALDRVRQLELKVEASTLALKACLGARAAASMAVTNKRLEVATVRNAERQMFGAGAFAVAPGILGIMAREAVLQTMDDKAAFEDLIPRLERFREAAARVGVDVDVDTYRRAANDGLVAHGMKALSTDDCAMVVSDMDQYAAGINKERTEAESAHEAAKNELLAMVRSGG